MTTPNDPRWSENPQPGQGGSQPPAHGQPPYGPQQGQPPYGPPHGAPPSGPQYGPPEYGQPQYAPQHGRPEFAPQYGPGPQHGAEELLGPAEPRRRRGHGKAIAIAAAAVVVLGGGIATYAAVSTSSGASGSATPQQAVQKLFTDLGRSDLIGMLDDLTPAERTAIAKPVQDTITAFQHEGILAPDANLNHLSGVDIRTSNLVFAPNTITINDRVQVVRVTGGTITFDADAAKLPLAGNLLRQIGAHAGSTTAHHTVNIAQEVRRTGQPPRIATQKVDGRWYPSLLYTIADNATTSAGLAPPNPADAIPARGASSPDAAVRQVLGDLLAGRVEQAIELSSPDEDAVLHDYGKYIVDRAHYAPAPLHINNITFTDKPISGATLVSVKSITATVNGQRVSVSRQGGCVEFRGMGQDQRLCRGDIARMLRSSGIPATAAEGLLSGSTNTGIVTSESGGKWYVNPIRTLLDVGPALAPLVAAAVHAGPSVGVGHGGGLPIPFPMPSPTR